VVNASCLLGLATVLGMNVSVVLASDQTHIPTTKKVEIRKLPCCNLPVSAKEGLQTRGPTQDSFLEGASLMRSFFGSSRKVEKDCASEDDVAARLASLAARPSIIVHTKIPSG